MSTGPESQDPQQPNPPYGDPPPPPPQAPQAPPGQQPPGYGQAPPPAGYQPGYPPGRPPVQAPLRPDDEKLWAIAAHLGPIILGFVAPLVVWLVYRDRSAFLDRSAKEALNFQLTLLIGYVVSAVLFIVLIGILLFFVVWIVGIVFMIMATISVSKFEDYRYPVNIRFIK